MADDNTVVADQPVAEPTGAISPAMHAAEPQVPAQPSDADQAAQAREAAATRQRSSVRSGAPVPEQPIIFGARQKTTVPKAVSDEEPNVYARFGTSEDDGIDLYERFRLNAVNAFYRGTLAGAGQMMALSHLVKNLDSPDMPPEEKKTRDAQRAEYQRIVGDLARYDLIASWSGGGEAAAALGGSLAGSLLTPESVLGVPARGATMLLRTGRAALQQAGIMGAVDPVVQAMSISAGTEQHYDPWRTVGAIGLGAIIGGGLHMGGELIGNLKLKRTIADLAKEDEAFYKPSQDEVTNVGREPAEPATPGEPTAAPTRTAEGEPGAAPVPEDRGGAQGREGGVEAGEIKEAAAKAPPAVVDLSSPGFRSATIRDTEISYTVGTDGSVEISMVRTPKERRGEGSAREALEAFLAETDAAGMRTVLTADPMERSVKKGGLVDFYRSLGFVPNKGRNKDFSTRAEFIRAPSGSEVVARRGGDGEMYSVSVPRDEVRPTDRPLAAEGEQASIAARQSGGRLPMEAKRDAAGTASPTGTAVVPAAGRELATIPETASPAKETAIRSLQQQSMDLADALGFPLRQGRIQGPKSVLGVYKSKSGVVRVREVPDFEVVAHEAGHYVEARVGEDLSNMIETYGPLELNKLVSDPLAYDPSQYPKEGFAEYIRRYMGNPEYAKAQAPGFTVAFRELMDKRHPEILRAIDDASATYRAYLEAPSVDAVGAVIRSQDEGHHGWRSWLPKKLRDEGFPVIIKTMMQDAYTAFLDKNAPVARAVREMTQAIKEAHGGDLVDLKAADNPEVLMRLFARSQQAAVRDMMDGVRGYRSITPEGPSLSQALAKATGEASVFGRWNQELKDAFSTYLIARRAGVLWERFNKGDLPNPPTAFSRGDANVALAELERANPQFREASDMVHAWTRQLLKKQYDGGLIGADLYDKLIREEFYVPFMRDLSDKPLAGGGTGGGSATPGERVADTVKRLKGSARDIKDPIESLMTQAFLVNRTLRHNDIIVSLENLAGEAGMHGGKFFEKIPANEMKKYTFDLGDAIKRAAHEKGMNVEDTEVLTSALADVFGPDPIVGSFFKSEPAGARGEPIVFYKKGGVMHAGRVMAESEGHALYETLTALPQGLSDVGLQLLSTGSSILRGTIVTNPVFALTNYIRDQVAVGILRPDYIPFVSGTKGLVAEATQGESAKLYGYAGAVSAGASVAPLEQAAKAEVNALAKQGYIVNRVSSLHGFLEMASITEAGTRNSVFDTVFKQKRAQGLSDYESMIEAAYQAQDILDFSRWGSKTMAIRALTPFVNAHMQGLEKAYRTLIEPLYRTAVTTVDEGMRKNAIIGLTKAMAVGGTLGAAWAALHHNDEIYQDAKPELKGTHFVTSIGNKIFVIPKPFELSLGFTAGEFAYQKLMKDDPRAAAGFAEASWEVLKPPIPLFDNPLIKTSMELYLGKSGFFGRDIVPDQLQRLNVAEQYTDRTSSMAKAIGQTIGVSPIKVDYAVGAYFGLWGRDIMALSSGVDERTPAQNWEDRALVRRFIKDPTRSSDTVTQFWKFMGQTTGQFNQSVATYDFLNKSFRDDDAKAFLAKLPANERAFVTLKSAANEDGKPAFNADDKRLFPLQRAYDAVTILNGLRRELSDDTFKTYEAGVNVKLSPRERRDLIDGLREMAQTEMRNSFVVMKTPGWATRPIMDLAPVMEKLRTVSPQVADEVATRYATGRVYTTKSVAASYDKLRDELVRNGSQADLADMTADAKGDGYEFGGDRVRKPQKRRVSITGQPPVPVRPVVPSAISGATAIAP